MGYNQRKGENIQLDEGICALCAEPAKLKMSHYLPAGAYRALIKAKHRSETSFKLLDQERGKILLSNRQLMRRMLCENCERRFSSNGETVVLKEILRDEGSFVCREKLAKARHSMIENNMHFYTVDIAGPAIDFEAYYYFALSIFWRGTVARWSEQTCHYLGTVIPRYRKQMRRHLLGRCPPPDDLFLWVEVDVSTNPTAMLSFPDLKIAPSGSGVADHHRFVVPGVIFRLFVGPNVQNFLAKVSETSGMPMMFSTSKFYEDGIFRPIVQKLNNAIPVGKLKT
jgi:hypothetical protein